MLNYIQRDAALIRDCLPKGTPVPDEAEDLFLVYAVLMRAKGISTQAADVHDAWSSWMTQRDSNHESIRDFTELDRETQSEDEPFLRAILRAAELRATRS